MNQYVPPQVTVAAEDFITVLVRAVIGLEVCVREEMCFEITALVEGLAASVALVGRFLVRENIINSFYKIKSYESLL